MDTQNITPLTPQKDRQVSGWLSFFLFVVGLGAAITVVTSIADFSLDAYDIGVGDFFIYLVALIDIVYVFGLFGMALFVNYMGFGDSILAGSLTLGLLCVPLVIRTTEEALKAIPDSMREGSRALGATRLQTIWHVILPMGMPNIITGLILALGRVSGETAPILFTCAAYFLPQLPTSILDQCMALPYHLYVISTSGTDMEAQLPLAYGTALVLIVIILLVNLLANALRKYFEKRVKTN